MKRRIYFVILLLLSFETIFLAIKNRQLYSKLDEYETYLTTGTDTNDYLGRNIANIEITSLENGTPFRLGNLISENGGVLFVFSTDCFSCDEAAEPWNKIAEENSSGRRILGLSKNDATETNLYMQRNHVRFPVFLLAKDKKIDEFQVTPGTFLLDGSGVILETIKGLPSSGKLHF